MKNMLSRVWKSAASGLGVAALLAVVTGTGSGSALNTERVPSFQPPSKRLVLELSNAASSEVDQASTMHHYSHSSHRSHSSHTSHRSHYSHYSGR